MIVAVPGCRLALLTAVAAAWSVCLAAQDVARPELAVGSVAGFVRYVSGQAIPDVRVTLLDPRDRLARTTRTGADGSFRFDAAPAGEYQLSASLPGAVARPIRIVAGSSVNGIAFSIPDGSRRRVVPARVVMNRT